MNNYLLLTYCIYFEQVADKDGTGDVSYSEFITLMRQ